MLIVMSSRSSAAGELVRSVSAIHFSGHGEIHGLAAERLGSSEWVALPVVGEHDPPQVRVALKLDAKQVKDLALVPIGGRYERGDARRLTIGARFEPQPRVVFQRVEQIHQFEPLFAREAIDSREIDETVVAQRLARAPHAFGQIGQGHPHGGDAVGGQGDNARLEDGLHVQTRGHQLAVVPEGLAEGGSASAVWTMPTPAPVRAPWRALRLSSAMRSLSLISESSSASGVGGQPGTYTSTGTILSTPWISA